MLRRRRSGFIFFLLGTRSIVRDDNAPPLKGSCPNCRKDTTLISKTTRPWFTMFLIPIFPIGGKQRITQCTNCGAQFRIPIEQMAQRLTSGQNEDHQKAIALYNSLRASPANSITLDQLMQMYGRMGEYDQAISAARDFPDALHNSEQCMSTLGRILLAAGRHEEAINWFDAALQRNPQLGDALYHKALACLGCKPSRITEATVAARAARNSGYPNADQLLQQIEARARESA